MKRHLIWAVAVLGAVAFPPACKRDPAGSAPAASSKVSAATAPSTDKQAEAKKAADDKREAERAARASKVRATVEWRDLKPMDPLDPEDRILTFCGRHKLQGTYVVCRLKNDAPFDAAIYNENCPALARLDGCSPDPTETEANKGSFYCCPR